MTQLLQNAVYGAVLILAVAALRRGLKDRLAPEVRLALWAVCLFRLLTPAAPESILSLWGFGRRLMGEAAPAPGSVQAAPNGGGTFLLDPAVPGMTAPAVPAPVEAEIPWGMILAGVWLAVGTALAVRYVLAYARTRRAVACAIPIGRDDPRYAPLPRWARLREGPMDGAPLTFGAVRPTVVLSPGLDGAELECVLAHEGVHARRRDNLWHYAAAVALAVHWWNPAVWLMARLLRRDVELSCDRAAVKKLGYDRRADYANALVSMATQAEGPAFCQTFGRKMAEERILSVMKYKKMTVAGAALSLALVLAVTVGFASDPAEPMPDEDSTTSSAASTQIWSMSCDAENNLTAVAINLGALEKNLSEHVADGSMTEQDAAGYLEQARAAALDGVMMRWTFVEDSGLVVSHNHAESAEDFPVFCKTEDGGLEPVDLATMVSRFIFTENPNGHVTNFVSRYPETVEFMGRTYNRADLSQETLDWLDWFLALSEEEQPALSYVPAELIQGRDPETQEAEDYASDDTRRVSIDEYKALLDGLAADGKMSREDADWLYAGAKQAMDEAEANGQGDIVVLQTNGTGSYAIMTVPPCNRPDCGNYDIHQHDGVTYSGWMPGVAEDEDMGGEISELLGQYATQPVYIDENGYPVDEDGNHLVFDENGELFMKFTVGYGLCIKEDCTVSGRHYHKDGQVVHVPEDTAPTPAFEPVLDNVPVSYPYCPVCTETQLHRHTDGQTILLDDPCPVDGCTILGEHTHGGVHYSCNGAGHAEGHCDGSCYSNNDPIACPPEVIDQTFPTSTHHSESHHSGHH